MKNLTRILWLCLGMIWSSCAFSFAGPKPHDGLLSVPGENIRQANALYHHQLGQIEALQGIVQVQAAQILEQRMAFEQCRMQVQSLYTGMDRMSLQLSEKDRIISLEQTKTKVVTTIATIVVTYLILNRQ